MGPVIIFVAIWTFLCLVYFAVNIAIDLFGKNGGKPHTEVIHVGGKDKKDDGGAGSPSGESPVVVTEYDDGGYGIREPGKDEEYVNTNGVKTPDSTTGHQVGSAAGSEEYSQEPLLDIAKKAKEQTTVISADYQSDTKSADEIDEIRRLAGEMEPDDDVEPDF